MQSGSSSGFSLCLALNVKKGECLDDPTSGEAKKVACGGGGEFEVLEVIDGKSDPEACADVEGTDDGFLYTEPALVICGKKN
ncbi:MAG: hypothetical protein M3548_01295 [Actinomycetota bacterium]|nr:hypothetical protein [Actinomycetota bacterium]